MAIILVLKNLFLSIRLLLYGINEINKYLTPNTHALDETKEVIEEAKWDELTTMEVLRLRKYISPLDTSTTDTQWNAMEKMANDIERNKDHEIK